MHIYTNIKRVLLLIISLSILMVTAGCSKEKPYCEGQELILAAREAYKALNSGSLLVSETDTGDVISRFTFLYTPKNVLNFVFESQTDTTYYEYYDGKSLLVQKNGEVNEFKWPSKVYKKYTKKDRNPNVDVGMFFFEPEHVATISQEDNDSHTHKLTYHYNPQTLGKSLGQQNLAGFTTIYTFEKETGKFISLEEVSVMEGGSNSSFTVTIEREDDVKELVNPITLEKK